MRDEGSAGTLQVLQGVRRGVSAHFARFSGITAEVIAENLPDIKAIHLIFPATLLNLPA